jgi:hypothetical protein
MEGGVTVMTGGFALGSVVISNGLPWRVSTAFFTPALAQGIPSPSPLPAAASTPPADGGSGALIVIGIFVALFVVVAAIAKVHEVRRRREDEGLVLQARLSDVLLMDPRLSGVAVVPTVRVPVRKGSPVRIEVSGNVPSPEVRERALRVIRQEATRFAQYALDVEVDDRLSVLPPIGTRHAA